MLIAGKKRRIRLASALLVFGLSIWAGANADRVLVVDDPQPSDVVLVLAGETGQRPSRALQLLDLGYARRMVINAPAREMVYDFTLVDLANRYAQGLPEAAAISVCSNNGLSTKEEARDVAKCLREEDRRVLIVTSDFHTRRALSIFRHELPGKSFSVAAARDSTQYGARWWTHRQWAKTFFDEWLRLAWWQVVDRWY